MDIVKHYNLVHANKVVYFSGMDSKELWEKNKNTELLKRNGWDDEHSIVYSYNSHGFRCDEFNNEPAYIALGCSFTEGVGLQLEYTWPYQLSQLLNYPVLNLGVGGASMDTIFRILEHYINRLNIVGVFLLKPLNERFEYFEDGIPVVYSPQRDTSVIYKNFILSEENVYFSNKKTLYAIKHICMTNNVNLFTYNINLSDGISDVDLARDLTHPGKQAMKLYSNIFYNMV